MDEDERQRELRERAPGAAEDMYRIAERTKKAADLIASGEETRELKDLLVDLTRTWMVLIMSAIAKPGTTDDAILEAAEIAGMAGERYMNQQQQQWSAAEPKEEHNPWLH